MPYNDLLINESDDNNKAYSCCMECSLGFIDYTKLPDNQYKYVFVYQDNLTKFMILKPLKEKEKSEISHCLLEIFSLIGVPSIIYTHEKVFVKSVFNKEIRNFCQNFPTKIKQSRYRTFKEIDCHRIDEEIKQWIRSTNSTNWSKGVYFVQFYYNCGYNETVKGAPFKTLLKPNYTYSRRKYTRYLFQKTCYDETLESLFLKHPGSNSEQKKGGKKQFYVPNYRQQINGKDLPLLKEQDDGTKYSKNHRLVKKYYAGTLINGCDMEMFPKELDENKYQSNTQDRVREPVNIINLENEHESKTLHEHLPVNTISKEPCNNNPVNKNKIIQDICFSLNEECGQEKEYKDVLGKTLCHFNKLSNSLRKINLFEEKQNECQKNNLLKRIRRFVNVFENDLFKNPEELYGVSYDHESSFMNNYCDSKKLCEEILEYYEQTKCGKNNNRLNMSDTSIKNVFKLIDNHKNDITKVKSKQIYDNFREGNINHEFYNYDNLSAGSDFEVPLHNENSTINSTIINENSEKIGWCDNKENNLHNLKENNLKTNSVRFAHEYFGKHQNCLTCKKKKKLKKGRFAIGSTVRVRVPVTQRLKGYPNYISAIIIEEKHKMFKVATPFGILKEVFKKDQLRPCDRSLLEINGTPTMKVIEPSTALRSEPNALLKNKLIKRNFKK